MCVGGGGKRERGRKKEREREREKREGDREREGGGLMIRCRFHLWPPTVFYLNKTIIHATRNFEPQGTLCYLLLLPFSVAVSLPPHPSKEEIGDNTTQHQTEGEGKGPR